MRIRILIILLAFISTGCTTNKENTGFSFMPEMTEELGHNSKKGAITVNDSVLLPVPGTVSMNDSTHRSYSKSATDRKKAALEMTNPIPKTSIYIETGKKAYTQLCVQCHGNNGEGKGNLVQENLYPFTPSSLIEAKVIDLKDGALYHSIEYGYGVMGAHGYMLTEVEKWSLVHYIRTFQGKN